MQTAFVFFCFMALIASCRAVCCGIHVGCTGYCYGVGQCNFFCCNCDGGCRSPTAGCLFKASFKSEGTFKNPSEIFNSIDSDQDGVFTFDEALKYANSHLDEISKGNVTDLEGDRSWFNSMDKDLDGKVKPEEFDSSF